MRFSPVTVLLALGLVSPALAQGPLTPTGPPAPSLKTLSQVEPRMDISMLPVASGVRTISQPGSYYLSANLSGESISIQASHVTLDLSGFTVQGAAAAGSGIVVNSASRAIRIYNGGISGWSEYGINLGTAGDVSIESVSIDLCGADGIFGQPAGASLDKVSISNSGGGARLGLGKANQVRASRFATLTCNFNVASADLIEDTTVEACSVSGSPTTQAALDGYVVSRCTITNTSLAGGGACIRGTVVIESLAGSCTTSGGSEIDEIIGIAGGTVSRCAVQGISSSSTRVTGIRGGYKVDGCHVTNLTIAPAGVTGIGAPAVFDSSVDRLFSSGSAGRVRGIEILAQPNQKGGGAFRCTVGNVSGGVVGPVGGMSGTGIHAVQGAVENCSVTSCGTAVEVYISSSVRDCTLYSGTCGILSSPAGGDPGNRIDGNNIASFTYGVAILAPSFVVRNSFRNCGIPLFGPPPSGSQIGELITTTGTIPSTASPWANFSQ